MAKYIIGPDYYSVFGMAIRLATTKRNTKHSTTKTAVMAPIVIAMILVFL